MYMSIYIHTYNIHRTMAYNSLLILEVEVLAKVLAEGQASPPVAIVRFRHNKLMNPSCGLTYCWAAHERTGMRIA